MSAEECLVSDWSAIGYEDGARGYTTDRFSQHRKACAKHGIAADFEAYKRGREEGLLEFCQPARGYTLGVNGGRYNGVCSADVEAEFVQAYNAGHRLYSLRAAVGSAESAIRAKQGELEYAEKRIVAIGVDLISTKTTTEQRVELLAEMKELSERTGQLESEIEFLIADKARAEQELQNYEQTVAAQSY
jgi:hypothetical protein